MKGRKARATAPRRVVPSEELVPADHFSRHLDRVLDLAFVRNLVRHTYAPAGRPSIDPVVFFRPRRRRPAGAPAWATTTTT